MRPIRILLVDDEPALARALCRLLGRRGHDVTVATGLAEARAIAREVRPDVVVADLHLRDGSGADLLSELERVGEGRIGLVLTTGDSSAPVDFPVLRKPFPPAALDAMLRRVAPSGAA